MSERTIHRGYDLPRHGMSLPDYCELLRDTFEKIDADITDAREKIDDLIAQIDIDLDDIREKCEAISVPEIMHAPSSDFTLDDPPPLDIKDKVFTVAWLCAYQKWKDRYYPNIVFVSNINVDIGAGSAREGENIRATCEVIPARADDRTVKWSSSAPKVATIDPDTGNIRAIRIGETVIRATAQDGSGTYGETTLTVTPTLVSGIDVYITPSVVKVGEYAVAEAQIHPDNASVTDVTWKSSSPSAVNISTNGQITTRSTGSFTITATSTDGSNVSGSAVIRVTGR